MQNSLLMGTENGKNTVIAIDAQKVSVPEYHGLFKKKHSDIELIPYPIENHIYMFKKEFRETIVGEILKTKRFGKRPPKFLATFLKNTYGFSLYEIFFKPYYQKIFQQDLKNILFADVENLFTKTSAKEILLSNFNCAGDNLANSEENNFSCQVKTEVFVKTDRNSYTSVLIPNQNFKALKIICLSNIEDCSDKEYNAVIEFVGELSKEEILEELPKLPLNPKFICLKSGLSE